jgi:transposase InsO family protein
VTKLREYLADETFVVETDQQPARNIHLNRSSTNRRVNNWKLQLQDYDIAEIRHKPGTTNCDADYMSRHPLIDNDGPNEELEGVCVVLTKSKSKQQDAALTTPAPSISPSITASPVDYHLQPIKLSPLDPCRIKKEQYNDQEIQKKIRDIRFKPDDQLAIRSGILNMKLKNGKYVPIIPIALRDEILHSFHDHPTAGHFGRDKTWNRLKHRCSWPNIRQDVIHYIRSCRACTQNNVRRQKPPGAMELIEPPGEVFDLVQMNFAGPFTQSTNENRYVIILTDYLSKYVLSKAVPNNSATTTAEFLVDVSLEFGPPHQLQTDRGSHFTSAVFEIVAERLGCVHTVSTPYHPQSQGVVERFNATFKQQLAKYTNEHYDDWDDYLQAVVSSYNGAIHQVTKFTPFQIFHKRNPVSLFDPVKQHLTIPRVSDYWNNFLRFEKVYLEQVHWNIRQQQERAEARYDRNRPDIKFQVGQNVLSLNQEFVLHFENYLKDRIRLLINLTANIRCC